MKTVIAALEDVAEPLRGEYEAKNGKFFLKVEGDYQPLIEANAKVIQFRDKNIALLQENDELRPLKIKFEGIDPDEAKTAIEKVKGLGKKGIKDAEDFDARVKATVDEVIKPLREQLTASTAETQKERQRADEFLLHSEITDKFIKAGGKANAADFVVNLAKENFEVKDRGIVTKTGKFSTEKPGDALGVDEWLKSIQTDHDYVFEPSKGGGAPIIKGGGGAPAVKVRPGQIILKNPTPQELGQFSADIAAGKVKIVNDGAVA